MSPSPSRYLGCDMGAITLNMAKITYRSPPISSGISLMLFRLLVHRVAIPDMKVVKNWSGSAKEGLQLNWSRLSNELLLFPCSPPSKWGCCVVTKGLNRVYDVTRLPVTCLDTHTHAPKWLFQGTLGIKGVITMETSVVHLWSTSKYLLLLSFTTVLLLRCGLTPGLFPYFFLYVLKFT